MKNTPLYLEDIVNVIQSINPKTPLDDILRHELALSSIVVEANEIVLLAEGRDGGGWAHYLTTDGGLITTSQAEPIYTEETKAIISALQEALQDADLPAKVQRTIRAFVSA